MAKGIIVSTPRPTKPKGQILIVLFDGSNTERSGHWLGFENKTGHELAVNDTVLCTLTAPLLCDVTGTFVASRGMVTQAFVPNAGGRVKLSQVEQNEFGVQVNDEVIFDYLPDADGNYPPPDPVNTTGGLIEVILTSGGSPSANGRCIFVKAL
ncbi:MAG: hypothetical protein JST06_10855 [Bacteroidetes bacterium]|nr:hypothetical protein [Bacteroidota bacterium]MBS1630359.1 hypothetical protein [Bacteroidota bacterium]